MEVTFALGPTTGLVSRQLTITRIPGAGDNVPMDAHYDTNVGLVESASVDLQDNRLWQAVLVDHLSDGSQRPAQIVNFNTGSLQYVQKQADHDRESGSSFYILNMIDKSSSSSQSASSLSSSTLSSSTASSASSVSSSSSSQSA